MSLANASYVNWLDTSGKLLQGYNSVSLAVVMEQLRLGVTFPQLMTAATAVRLTSNAKLPEPFTLENIKFYLTGDAAALAQVYSWGPAAGVDISFDSGKSWMRFSSTVGNALLPSSWLLMDGSAVGPLAPDGQLSYDDQASISLRIQTPITPTLYGLFLLKLGIDFDVF